MQTVQNLKTFVIESASVQMTSCHQMSPPSPHCWQQFHILASDLNNICKPDISIQRLESTSRLFLSNLKLSDVDGPGSFWTRTRLLLQSLPRRFLRWSDLKVGNRLQKRSRPRERKMLGESSVSTAQRCGGLIAPMEEGSTDRCNLQCNKRLRCNNAIRAQLI